MTHSILLGQWGREPSVTGGFGTPGLDNGKKRSRVHKEFQAVAPHWIITASSEKSYILDFRIMVNKIFFKKYYSGNE